VVRAVVCLGLTAGLLGGCWWDRSEEPGVVAVVGGSPIRLAELEARHDLVRLGLPQADNPAVEELRAEYGAALAGLIVARLVNQELTRLGMALSTEERAAAEAAVRAEYPGDSFEGMLLEEHIDLPRWREMLADRLALEKFTREVLRPNIRVGVSEAATYYKEHIDAFTKPAAVRLRIVAGRDAEAVKAALAAVRKSGQPEADSGMQEVVLPEAGLPPAWREALKSRKPGEATPLLAVGHEYLGLILLERLAATVLDPAKAYARVESLLAAEKLGKAFDAWLAETLTGATIRVNSRLLARPDPVAAEAATDGGQTEQAELAAARTQGQASEYIAEQARRTLAGKQAGAADNNQNQEPPSPAAAPGLDRAVPTVAEQTPASTPAPAAEASGARTPPVPAGETELAATVSPGSGPPPVPVPAAPANQDTALTPEPVLPPTLVPASPAVEPTAMPPAEPATTAGRFESTPAEAPLPPALPAAKQAVTGPGEVELTALKASWVLYTVDDGAEERVYLKPGKPHRVAYARRLTVRLGSPSEVAYRAGSREETVVVGKKESRVLEFP
jgi:cytoskeletal protein RodZ